MKQILFGIMLVAFCALAGFAQDNSAVEKDFEKNRSKLKLEKFTEGEDANSGFYYLYYKNKSETVKIRQAWRSWSYKEHDTTDYYFKDGKLVLSITYPRTKTQLQSAISGKVLTIAPIEKLYFTDGKLTKWIEKGKDVSTDDKRWKDKEAEELKSADDIKAYYTDLKGSN